VIMLAGLIEDPKVGERYAMHDELQRG